jgi:methylphosphotriester-DNA--protein-cysteine methyltransferase
MQLLAPGDSVTNAPVSAGDASTSAFIAAFKKTFGPTPRRLPAA